MKTIRNTNSPPWIDGEVRHLIRKKNAALQRFRQNKTAERKLKLRIISQNIKCSVRRKHQYYLAKTAMSFKHNPKIFWSYHKAFLGVRSGANSVVSYNSVAAEKPAEKAELLNNYFCSIFAWLLPLQITYDSLTDMEILQVEVLVDEVRECLGRHLKGAWTRWHPSASFERML